MSSLALSLFLALHGGAPHRGPADAGPPAPVEDVTALTLDELIERLPRIAQESDWIGDELVGGDRSPWVTRPEVFELERRLEASVALSASQWREALVRSGALRLRERWPRGVPFAVSMRSPYWLPCGTVQLRSKGLHLRPARLVTPPPGLCGYTYDIAREAAAYQELGRLPPGRRELMFGLTVTRDDTTRHHRAPSAPPLEAGTLVFGHVTFPVEITATLDDAIPPVGGGRWDAAVRESLGLAFSGECRNGCLVVDPDLVRYPELCGVGLSLEVEVLRGDEVVETVRVRATDEDHLALASAAEDGPHEAIGFAKLESLPPALEAVLEAGREFSLRVRGTDRDVLTLWHCDRRYSGEFTVSAAWLRKQELLRAGPEGRAPKLYYVRHCPVPCRTPLAAQASEPRRAEAGADDRGRDRAPGLHYDRAPTPLVP